MAQKTYQSSLDPQADMRWWPGTLVGPGMGMPARW